MEIPTLKIKSTDGYTLINADEFDPSVHERWEAPAVPEVPEVLEIPAVLEVPAVQPASQPAAPKVRRTLKKKI
jgi:hypothetical protein